MKLIVKTIALTTLSLICVSAAAHQMTIQTTAEDAQGRTLTIEKKIDFGYTENQMFIIEKLKEVNPSYYDKAWQYTKERLYLSADDFDSLNGYRKMQAREILFPIAIEYLIQHHPEVLK